MKKRRMAHSKEFGIFRNSKFKIRILDFFGNWKLEIGNSCRSGQAMLLSALFFLLISMTITLGVVYPVTSHLSSTEAIERGAESLYAAQGVSEDVNYRLMKGMPVGTTETLSYGTVSATATTTTVSDGKEVQATGNSSAYLRKSKTHLSLGAGASFHYGMQSGEGGIVLNNSSSISGNVYSNGSVVGSGGNLIKGTVVSAGAAGKIDSVHATSTAYAHTITNADIDGDAYYQSISGTTVGGTLHAGSQDQATTSLPISDATITNWETAAAAGGTYGGTCPYNTPSTVTLGPIKIPCDLNIGSDTVTLAGPVWVTGSITIDNSTSVKVDSSLGSQSVAMIADKSGDRATGSAIVVKNNNSFQGSGSAGSNVLLISQNNSAETGGSESAITASNSASGDLLLYAGHGKIEVNNNVSLKEVTGYQIELNNSANIIYQTGLANLIFSSGPSGGYLFDTWREVE